MFRKWFEDEDEKEADYEALIRECGCSGSILIAADEYAGVKGTQSVTPASLQDAHRGFDYVIIGYKRRSSILRSQSC